MKYLYLLFRQHALQFYFSIRYILTFSSSFLWDVDHYQSFYHSVIFSHLSDLHFLFTTFHFDILNLKHNLNQFSLLWFTFFFDALFLGKFNQFLLFHYLILYNYVLAFLHLIKLISIFCLDFKSFFSSFNLFI